MTGDVFFGRIVSDIGLAGLDPQAMASLSAYLSAQKVIAFGDQYVLDTLFPPYPSRAFAGFVNGVLAAQRQDQPLYSVSLAVTNRCELRCWHCYNADRSRQDVPLERLRNLARELQDRGAVKVMITGGEPLLRTDLAEICRCFDDRSFLILATTGWGLTAQRARELKDSGVFAIAVSLDSDRQEEHDAKRGREGAFQVALQALRHAKEVGLFRYVETVASRDLLRRERFLPFMEFARDAGALQVSLGEPRLTGRLAKRQDEPRDVARRAAGRIALHGVDRREMLAYQAEIARREDLPVLQTDTHIGSRQAFGCGAGLTHIYIDGSGELCPCNFVPLSFGNVASEGLDIPLQRMRNHFRTPRSLCAAWQLSHGIPKDSHPPVGPKESSRICREYPPRKRGPAGSLVKPSQGQYLPVARSPVDKPASA
jgi:MoaA/NifB/PqqE/SkfB family radical SAM enzyme